MSAEPQSLILKAWDSLSESERAAMIPFLLERTEEWKTRTFDDTTCVSWLRWRFSKDRIPFLESHLSYVEALLTEH